MPSAEANCFTVTVQVACSVSLAVTVMWAVPTLTPVTIPLSFTVATCSLSLVHARV